MSFQEEIFDKIEAYLNGEFDATEVKAFEHQISIDESLKHELEKHKIANALIVENRLLAVKNILQTERVKSTDSSFNKPLGFIVLAVATIGVGASLLILNQKDDTTVLMKQEKGNSEVVSNISKSNLTHSNSVKIKSNNLVTEGTHESQAQVATSEQNNGFHKHQIQMIENQMSLIEKDISKTDSSNIFIEKQNGVPQQKTTYNTPVVKQIVVATACEQVSIQASVMTTPSCSDKASGSILVQSITGGTKPYSIALSSNTNESVSNGEISKGMYQALITDANGCTHRYSNLVVNEKECTIDYSFNPFYGDEEWNIAPQASDGQLEIFNKGGMLYYQKNIPAQITYKWNGMGIGNQIIPGYYIFVIKYADGAVKRGSVTIVQ
jgi:hypothetical protein